VFAERKLPGNGLGVPEADFWPETTVVAEKLIAERPHTDPHIDACGSHQGCVTAKRVLGIRMQMGG